MRAVRPAGTAVGVLATAGVLASLLAAPPAAAQAVPEPGPRDVLVVDVLDTRSHAAHVVYDSTTASAPVVGPGTVPGSLRFARPASATSGPGVELLLPDSGRLAVGTYTGVKGSWSTGARPAPVLRLLSAASTCTAFSTSLTGSLVVHAVSHDEAGVLTSLSASWRMPCSAGATVTASGELRYRSAADYAAVSSYATSLGSVVIGSRTGFTATIRNSGTVPVALGPPTSVTDASDAPRLAVVPDGDGCSGTPLAAGASCSLALEYVDDGIAGGGYVAGLRLAAPALARGHVSVLATVQDVVTLPVGPQSVRASSAYDGVRLMWSHDSGARVPDGWRIRRVDGGRRELLATLPFTTMRWQDTSLAKGESATYEVAAYNLAGEDAAAPVTVARQDRDDPPPAVGRRTLVVDEPTGSVVADTAAGADLRVHEWYGWTTRLSTPGAMLVLPLLDRPGTFTVGGSQPEHLDVEVYGPVTPCGRTTGTAVVREAWVRADGTVHRIDADFHLLCGSVRMEVALRIGTDTPFTAVTASPRKVADLHAEVGAAAVTRDVQLANPGTEPVDVAPATIGGDDATAFSIAGTTCGTVLPPAGTCVVTVAYAPQRSGTHSAALEVPVGTAIGTRRVDLAATADGHPPVRAVDATAVLGRVEVRWYAGPDGGSPVTGISVQRAVGAGAFTTIARVGPEAFSWVDPATAPGATYRYRLLTENRFGVAPPDDAPVATVVVPREELLVAVENPTDAHYSLASVPVAGGAPVRLPGGGDEDADLPAVSPDGRNLAYTVYDSSGDAALWLRPADGSTAPRQLVDVEGVDETDPAWSPDGRRVCYSRFTSSAAAVWCVATTPGAAPAAFPGAADAMEPSWLPDAGGLVVTDLAESVPRLARVSTSGARAALPGTAGGSWPAVSPRGDRIAFVLTDDRDVDHLRVVPLAGGTPVDLATSAQDLFGRPSWAPDGQALAVPAHGPWDDAHLVVWRAGPNGGGAESVRAARGYDVSAVAWRRQDLAAPTITFPGAGPTTSSAARVPVRVVDDTVPVGGLTVTCSVDGRPVARCASGWTGTLAAGAHRLTVTAQDLSGRTATATHSWTVDTVAPTVGVTALPAFTTARTATLSYGATDAGGVAGYDVRYRRAAWSAPGFSAHTVPAGWASTTARSRTLTVTSGYEYCFSVRARDRAGNLSPWSVERCTAVPLDDRALGRATGGWSSATASTAFAATLTRTTAAGARLVRPSAQSRRLALVATTCPTCGSVEVLVGTTRVGVLSLATPTTRTRQVLALPVLRSVRAGTITVRSLRTGRPVVVDGLGIRRT